MMDVGDTETVGCGKPLGTSDHYRVFCGRPNFMLCRDCKRLCDADPKAWTCPGCNFQIVEGQHYMEVSIRIDTRMPEDWQPVVEVSDTTMNVKVHGPACAMLYFDKDDVIQDVFGR